MNQCQLEPTKPKHIVIIAGEESGDIHAAHLIKSLFAQNPNYFISGIGGKHMQNAGATLIADLASYGVTGLTEVVKHLGTLRKAINQMKQHLRETKPDLLILVDYPGFNLRIAEYAKQTLGLKIIYYIGPQIWAWKAKRIHKIHANIDHMAVILPFEKKIYQDARIPVSFVGHPLSETLKTTLPCGQQRQILNLPTESTLVALLPGSRGHEIQRHMPIFMETATRLTAQHPSIHFVIPVAKTLSLQEIRHYIPANLTNITLIAGMATDVIASSNCVVVASGTASLECALLGKPMCIVYVGAWLSYVIAFLVIQVKYFGLCNLLWNRMLVPELLQYDCNPEELTKMVNQLLNPSSDIVQRMQIGFKTLKQDLSSEKVDESLLTLVNRYLSEQ